MDLIRVLRYCQNLIESEKKSLTPSVEKIKALEQILDFANNADTPQEKERIEIKEIFQKHHKDFKKTFYSFTKNQDREIDGIINQIKQEMIVNPQEYADMTVGQFFEIFMTNMDIANTDDFWKRNVFTTWGINKNFPKILSQIISGAASSRNQNKSSSGRGKPSYSSVMNENI